MKDDEQNPTLQRHYGGAVSGDQFWPRPEIIDNPVETLKGGESVSLFGLRRIGKSSAMKEAARIIEADDKDKAGHYIIIDIDAQDYNALDKLITEILLKLPAESSMYKTVKAKLLGNRYLPEALKEGLNLLFKNKGGDTQAFAKHIPGFWGPICKEITTAIAESKTQLILMIDEFPYMCKNLLAHEDGRDFIDSVAGYLSSVARWTDHDGDQWFNWHDVLS